MGKIQRDHRVSSNETRKAKDYLETNLTNTVKDSKKGFF